MKKAAAAILIWFAFWMALASMVFVKATAADFGPYSGRVVRVIDGDTLEVDVDIFPELTSRVHVRLAGVNTPESRGAGILPCELAAGEKAKQFVNNWVLYHQTNAVLVTVHGRDKYGRMLGNLRHGTEDLAEALIAAGHARRYAGERRGPWCLG